MRATTSPPTHSIIRRAIERITEVAPQTGLHLAASVRTGAVCRYEPMAGWPAEVENRR
jgi:hypothetical protein